MIIDAHAHYGQWLSAAEPDTPARFSEVLDRFGIEASVVSSARAIVYEIISGNREVAELIRTDDRVYGAVVVNPNHREASLAELSRYGQDERFVAVKMHPDYCGVAMDSAASLRIFRRIEELGLPLCVHTWGEGEVEATAAAARAFPGMRIVMFHMGADAWRVAVQRTAEYPNLYLEIASTLPDAERISAAVSRVGAERVFFGTDMTLLTPAYAFGLVRAAGLGADDEAKVMGGNAREFFGID